MLFATQPIFATEPTKVEVLFESLLHIIFGIAEQPAELAGDVLTVLP